MSGPNQHYIPRFILRGFGDPERPSHVWRYKRGDLRPKHSSIRKTASESYFYATREGDNTLDDRITQLENELAPIAEDLKNRPQGPLQAPVEPYLNLLIHLKIRTRHLRAVTSSAISQLVESMLSLVGDRDILRQAMGLDGGQMHARLSEVISEALATYPLAEQLGVTQETMSRILHYSVRELFEVMDIPDGAELSPQFASLAGGHTSIAADAQIKALGLLTTPEVRLEALKELSWQIRDYADPCLILPDCAAIARAAGEGWSSALFPSVKAVSEMVLFLTPYRALVGLRAGESASSSAVLREGAIGCSAEFVVSHELDESLASVMPDVGTAQRSQIDDLVADAIDDALAEHGITPDNEAPDNPNPNAQTSSKAMPETKYSCVFQAGTDPNIAQQIANQTVAAVAGFAEQNPLDDLNSISFVETSWTDLRPDSLLPIPTPGEPTASFEYIKLEDRTEVRIVLPLDVGNRLLSEDQRVLRSGIGALWAALSRVSLIGQFNARSKQVDDFEGRAPFELLLSHYLGDVFAAYWCEHESSGFLDKGWRGPADELLQVLDRALEIKVCARYWLSEDNNMGRFFDNAASIASSILILAARTAAHFDRLDSEVPTIFLENLQERGCAGWFKLLRRDLRRLYDQAPNWSSMSQFNRLNRHLERLLWMCGAFPEDRNDGQLWIVAPPMPYGDQNPR